ncbi:MAG: hypothetical protein JO033_19625, partial [Acidobacteriaceae bacterium]|nr:hypothetical protein [Acidobacteriaceae bacterium]
MTRRETPQIIRHFLAVLAGFAGIVLLLMKLPPPDLKPPPPRPSVAPRDVAKDNQKRGKLMLAGLVANELRHSMRDPDSFKLDSVLLMDSGAVCYEYRARNGF